MGSIITKEHRTYHPNGKLREYYFTKNDRLHGEYKTYHNNGILSCIFQCKNNQTIGSVFQYNSKGTLSEESFYKYNGEREYRKIYDTNGLLEIYITDGNDTCDLHARFYNNKLYHYRISHYSTYNVIYNTNSYFGEIIIKISIINSIRCLQRRFRKRFYKPIHNILNSILGVNDMSRLILSYMKK
jgi:antitoxin component YwqK of YwqJK toxin-antitoxin module